ncbi:MAG: prepilin peptidase [Patescibacteria group bacterium]|jgi:leader peptidase (prepilin peptidase)/N-methyltransferase
MVTSLFLIIIGCCLGSFISALAQRTASGTSNWSGRSRCENCHKSLSFTDLIPIISFLFRNGRCRFCGSAIGWHEPATELITGFVFALVGLAHNNNVDILLIRDLIFSVFLILLFLTDVYAGLLPHRFTITAVIIALAFNFGMSEETKNILSFQPLIGPAVCGGFFYLQYLISRGAWVGGGDIGMGAFLGAILGWQFGIFAIGLAYIIGATYAAVLLIKKEVGLSSRLPFGPFLAVAGWLVLIYGNTFLDLLFFH